MKAYIVFEFDPVDDGSFIVGVFSNGQIAEEVVSSLYAKNKGAYEYQIEEYELDIMHYKTEEEMEQDVSEIIEEMVKDGLIDYKVGEDGQFYFEVTDKGEESL